MNKNNSKDPEYQGVRVFTAEPAEEELAELVIEEEDGRGGQQDVEASLCSKAADAFAIGGYMLTSSLLLIVNKMAIEFVPTPGFLLFAQLLTATIVVWGLGRCGVIEVDALEWNKVASFWVVPASFVCTIFANIKILQHTNVETFIVFRASVPLGLCVLDTFFLDRDLPSKRSFVSLFVVLVGATMYMYFEKHSFTVDSIFWVCVWYALFCFDQVYIKHVVDTVSMTTWGRVYYTNLLPVGPLLVFGLLSGEHVYLRNWDPTFLAMGIILVSCAFGTAISFFAFKTRAAVSATAFTVVGNACKGITVLVNVFIWDKHASLPGILSLIVCLVAVYFYRQAPKINNPERRVMLYNKVRWYAARFVPILLVAFFVFMGIMIKSNPLVNKAWVGDGSGDSNHSSSGNNSNFDAGCRNVTNTKIIYVTKPVETAPPTSGSISSRYHQVDSSEKHRLEMDFECEPFLGVPKKQVTNVTWISDLIQGNIKVPKRIIAERTTRVLSSRDGALSQFNVDTSILPLEGDNWDNSYLLIYRHANTRKSDSRRGRTGACYETLGGDFFPSSRGCQFTHGADFRSFAFQGHAFSYTQIITNAAAMKQRRLELEALIYDLRTNQPYLVDLPEGEYETSGKNWTPLEFKNELYILYTLHPLIVLKVQNPFDPDFDISSAPKRQVYFGDMVPILSTKTIYRGPENLSIDKTMSLRGGGSAFTVMNTSFVVGIGHTTDERHNHQQRAFLYYFNMEDPEVFTHIPIDVPESPNLVFPISMFQSDGDKLHMTATESNDVWFGSIWGTEDSLLEYRNFIYDLKPDT